MGGDSPHKRKRDVDDMGSRAQKKVHVEDRNLGIDDLHLDVGEKYLLCRTRKASLLPVQSSRQCHNGSTRPHSAHAIAHVVRCVVVTVMFRSH